MNDSHSLIADAYRDHSTELVRFFVKYVQDIPTAEDLTQDVFVRLVEWNHKLNPETIRHLIFKIARNLLCDHLRRIYVKREYECHIAESNLLYDTTMESTIIAADIFRMECRIIAGLSPCRKKAYVLSRFAGWTSKEIAGFMGKSQRTAENNIFISRRQVREALRSCC